MLAPPFPQCVPPVSPITITLSPGDSSASIRFQVKAFGPFDQTVTLSCSGLPSGATCNFQLASSAQPACNSQPTTSVQPTATNPADVILTICTAATTTAGTFPVTITASVIDGPPRTQNLSLTVTKDYSLAISNSVLTAIVNTAVQLPPRWGTLTWLNKDKSGNGYSDLVNLRCGPGAPSTCTIAPATVTPTASGASFTAIVGSSQCGQYNFNIEAIGTDSAATSHAAAVTFSSTSLAPPDYTLEITNPSLAAPVNTTATFNGTLTASACYGSAVNLSCGSGHPPTCKASPASVTPTLAGAPFTVSVSSNKVAAYNFAIAGQGTDKSAILHVLPVSFTSTSASGSGFSFSISNTSGAESVTAGQTATYNLQVAAAANRKFPHEETFTLSLACPPLATCTFTPAEVPAGSIGAQVQLTINTTGAVASSVKPVAGNLGALYAVCLGWPGLIIVAGSRRSRFSRPLVCLLLLAMVALSLILACGGGLQGGSTAAVQPGTPAGTYNMTVSATPDAPTQPAAVTLTVN